MSHHYLDPVVALDCVGDAAEDKDNFEVGILKVKRLVKEFQSAGSPPAYKKSVDRLFDAVSKLEESVGDNDPSAAAAKKMLALGQQADRLLATMKKYPKGPPQPQQPRGGSPDMGLPPGDAPSAEDLAWAADPANQPGYVPPDMALSRDMAQAFGPASPPSQGGGLPGWAWGLVGGLAVGSIAFLFGRRSARSPELRAARRPPDLAPTPPRPKRTAQGKPILPTPPRRQTDPASPPPPPGIDMSKYLPLVDPRELEREAERERRAAREENSPTSYYISAKDLEESSRPKRKK